MPASILRPLVDAISEARPRHADYLNEALQRLTEQEATDAERYLHLLEGHGETIEALRTAYCALLDQTMEEQLHFQRNMQYRYSSFAEVADQVYFDEGFMHNYMIGLAISLYLWPNHLAIHRFFDERLPTKLTGSYLEIGPGHGNFLLHAMRDTQYSDFTGVDLSPTSIRLTREIMQSALPERMQDLELILSDFLSSDLPKETYDAVVMGEVLEHVEDPQALLERIREIVTPDGFVFVTTCINAPEIDHIYLYSNQDEVLAMFSAATLKVVKALTVPHHGYSLEQCEKMQLPINVAYELTRER